MEGPQLAAGAHVVGVLVGDLTLALVELRADVAHARSVEIGAEEEQVAEDGGDAGVGDLEVDGAFVAEARVDAAGAGVQCGELLLMRKQDTRRVVVIAGPVGDAAEAGETVRDFVGPDLFAGFGLERHHAIASRRVHDAVDDDGRHFLVELAGAVTGDRLAVAVEAIVPDLFQVGNIPGVDLFERREAGAFEVAQVHGPVGGGIALGLRQQRGQ